MKAKQARKTAKLKFEHRLVLVNWIFDLFGVVSFEDLAKNLRDPEFEGFNNRISELGTGSDFYWKSPKTKIGTVVHFFS